MIEDLYTTRLCATDGCGWNTSAPTGYCEGCRPTGQALREWKTDVWGWATYRRYDFRADGDEQC